MRLSNSSVFQSEELLPIFPELQADQELMVRVERIKQKADYRACHYCSRFCQIWVAEASQSGILAEITKYPNSSLAFPCPEFRPAVP